MARLPDATERTNTIAARETVLAVSASERLYGIDAAEVTDPSGLVRQPVTWSTDVVTYNGAVVYWE
jgi:hypothetical protein